MFKGLAPPKYVGQIDRKFRTMFNNNTQRVGVENAHI